MSSVNFMDIIAAKFSSFTSKMRGDSFPHYSPSYLMSDGNNSAYQWDLLKAVIGLKDNSVLDIEAINPYHPSAFLNQVLDANHDLKFHGNLAKSEHFFPRTKSGLLSPHLLNLISNLNSYHKNFRSEVSLLPSSSILFGNMVNNLFDTILEMKENSVVDSVMKKTSSLPVNSLAMSVNVSHSPSKTIKPTNEMDEKCSLSTDVKLNLKLANRKTKQMNKRSKKRRRRQKKSQHSGVGDSLTMSVNSPAGSSNKSVSSHVCFIAETPDFGCEVSFQQTIQIPSHVSSFVIPVECDSDDDSEWESYDEINNSNSSNSASDSEVDCGVLLSSSPSSVKSESTESRCSTPDGFVTFTSSLVSFVVPSRDSSDDDSDWDTCEADSSIETPDFELTGLFFTNLCTPRIPKAECISAVVSEDETDESSQLRKILLEVNKNWEYLATRDDEKSKSSTKVTFAPDEHLTEVFPVEIYERKGEWETYATERLRFKRKIDELEKVISPCLQPEHRTKVFKKLVESEL